MPRGQEGERQCLKRKENGAGNQIRNSEEP
jgi:hypothetical protein